MESGDLETHVDLIPQFTRTSSESFSEVHSDPPFRTLSLFKFCCWFLDYPPYFLHPVFSKFPPLTFSLHVILIDRRSLVHVTWYVSRFVQAK